MTQDEVAAASLVSGAFLLVVAIVALIAFAMAFWALLGIESSAKKTAKALERIEKALERDAKATDRVLRNMDANLATSATVLQDMAQAQEQE